MIGDVTNAVRITNPPVNQDFVRRKTELRQVSVAAFHQRKNNLSIMSSFSKLHRIAAQGLASLHSRRSENDKVKAPTKTTVSDILH